MRPLATSGMPGQFDGALRMFCAPMLHWWLLFEALCKSAPDVRRVLTPEFDPIVVGVVNSLVENFSEPTAARIISRVAELHLMDEGNLCGGCNILSFYCLAPALLEPRGGSL